MVALINHGGHPKGVAWLRKKCINKLQRLRSQMRDWLGSNAVPSNLKDGKVKLQGGGCGDRHGWNQKWHVQCPTKDINSSCLLFVCYLFWVDDLRLAKFSHVMAEAPWGKKSVILSRKDKLEDGRKLIENDMCLVFFWPRRKPTNIYEK